MNTIVESLTELGNIALDQVSEVQARVLEWNRQLAEVVVPRTATLPDPFGAKDLAAEWAQASFALQSKALEANRAFAAGLIEAWAPKAEGPQPPSSDG